MRKPTITSKTLFVVSMRGTSHGYGVTAKDAYKNWRKRRETAKAQRREHERIIQIAEHEKVCLENETKSMLRILQARHEKELSKLRSEIHDLTSTNIALARRIDASRP